jgi:hypothetical protein
MFFRSVCYHDGMAPNAAIPGHVSLVNARDIVTFAAGDASSSRAFLDHLHTRLAETGQT